jgi:predicted GNAT family acetyltransferase
MVINNKGIHMENNHEIFDVTDETIEDLSVLCVPPENRDQPAFVKGIQTKIEWAKTMLDTHGSFAKLAYVNSELAGMIQYVSIPHEQIIKIQCIFVPDKKFHKRGIGSRLTRALVNEMRNPQSAIDSLNPRALLAYAFEVPGWYSQHTFFEKMGFIPLANDPDYLYYPLQEGYVYTKNRYIPQEEDEGIALIFFDPSCPFSVPFHEKLIQSLTEITDIPIRVIDIFKEEDEVKKRGWVPHCAVNGVPIHSFVFDDTFSSEVKHALPEE